MEAILSWLIISAIFIGCSIVCAYISSLNEAYKNKKVRDYENDPIRRDLYK